MYEFQPSTSTDRLLLLAGSIANAAERLTNIVEIRDVVNQILIISKKEWQLDRFDHHLYFKLETLNYFLHVAHTFAQNNANT
jgi:hypothetical protein